MARFHATGAVSDPSKIGPHTEERMKILADLKGGGIVNMPTAEVRDLTSSPS